MAGAEAAKQGREIERGLVGHQRQQGSGVRHAALVCQGQRAAAQRLQHAGRHRVHCGPHPRSLRPHRRCIRGGNALLDELQGQTRGYVGNHEPLSGAGLRQGAEVGEKRVGGRLGRGEVDAPEDNADGLAEDGDGGGVDAAGGGVGGGGGSAVGDKVETEVEEDLRAGGLWQKLEKGGACEVGLAKGGACEGGAWLCADRKWRGIEEFDAGAKVVDDSPARHLET